MSIFEILYSIFITPIQLLFEFIYLNVNNIIDNPGLSIIALSLVINILILPLYRRADAMQEEERETEKRLHAGIAHIKKTFKGDERMMMLNTYYRQNNYKPTDVFKGSISLFLEIPFFIAAYQFLSHLSLLNGVSFGVIKDLGVEDALLHYRGLHVNALPILMTFINFISCYIFTKGSPLKTKIQLYGMATFFLFFLYTSPSGLVFYWTLNNVFSLVKTLFYKIDNAREIIYKGLLGLGTIVIIYAIAFFDNGVFEHKIVIAVLGIIMIIPFFAKKYGNKLSGHIPSKYTELKASTKGFLTCTLFMTILIGGLIPSAVIADSPQEFSDSSNLFNPSVFVLSSLCIAFGLFIVWFFVFRTLASDNKRGWFDLFVLILSGIAIYNYMFVGRDNGIFSRSLKYDVDFSYSTSGIIINLVICLLICIALYFLFLRARKVTLRIVLIATVSMLIMTGYNITQINSSINNGYKADKDIIPEFTLSTTGQNVVVIMLDRAMGAYIPFMINEKPELKEMYSGFTFYPNTISFGTHTNIGAPALFGGYEYTPDGMEERSDKLLVEKHDEALLLMPVIFSENGYKTSVANPPLAGYQWNGDLSIYDDYEDITAYNIGDYFLDAGSEEIYIKNNKRNFFYFALMKTSPEVMQSFIYNYGQYNMIADASNTETEEYSGQSQYDKLMADGLKREFMTSYLTLENFSGMTKVTNENVNTFFTINNDTVHESMMLQEPNYEPSIHVDNSAYEEKHLYRREDDRRWLKMDYTQHVEHYQSQMAALLELGEWMEYLKRNNLYDNTRIIIVADHGYELYQTYDMVMDEPIEGWSDIVSYNPLLMVKDFNADGFSISDEFMTNADVPTIAMSGLIQNPINPFTGKAITNEEKTAHDQHVSLSHLYNLDDNNGYVFVDEGYLSIHDNIFDQNNWELAK